MTPTKVFVDTTIFVNVLNKEDGYEKSSELLEEILKKNIGAFISVATIAEILSLYYKTDEKKATLAKTYIESIFDEENIVPVLKDIAEAAGKIKAMYKTSLGDALIIASALAVKCDNLIALDAGMKTGLINVREPDEII